MLWNKDADYMTNCLAFVPNLVYNYQINLSEVKSLFAQSL